MVIAILALVVASTGTAIAAGLVDGDSLIKQRSLSGNRLRDHTVTGKQIKLNALGTVPTANLAKTAKTANTAINAGHAATAGSATTAGAAATATTAGHAATADSATTAASASTATNVNGQQVVSLYASAAAGGAAQQLMNLAGVTIMVGCASGTNAPSMAISNTASPSQSARINIAAIGAGPAPYETQGDFSSTTLIGSGSTAGTGEANAVFADKHVVSVDYSYEGGGIGGSFGDCLFSGHAVAG
jgi:hypothetical protein